MKKIRQAVGVLLSLQLPHQESFVTQGASTAIPWAELKQSWTPAGPLNHCPAPKLVLNSLRYICPTSSFVFVLQIAQSGNSGAPRSMWFSSGLSFSSSSRPHRSPHHPNFTQFFLTETIVGVWKTERRVKIISSISFLKCHCPGWVQISSRGHRGVGSSSFSQWQQTLPMGQRKIAPGVCRLVLLPWRGSNGGIWAYFFYLH